MKTFIFSVVLLARSLSLFADDNSARRYGSLDTNASICKYYLLSTRQVQRYLDLTTAQIKAFESAMIGGLDSIFGLAALRRSQAEKLKVATSEQERSQIRSAGNEKAASLFEQARIAVLQNTLTPTQSTNLDRLL